jgi:hypothetical protein
MPLTRQEGAWEERKYSAYSFSTSEIDGGEWSASGPGRSLPPVPIEEEARWAPQPVSILQRAFVNNTYGKQIGGHDLPVMLILFILCKEHVKMFVNK